MTTRARPAAGGGRWVDAGPERLARWVAGFEERHGPAQVTASGDVVTLTGADGAVAECHPPFPPLPGTGTDDPVAALAAHAGRDRRVGVLLVRLGGFAVGVFDGLRLESSKVGTRPVHGRNKAGGWSQQRFARRREGQARELADAAADTAARILLPGRTALDALVLGGDRSTVDVVLADRRLTVLAPLVADRFLDVPDPRRTVLESTPGLFRAVRIRVTDGPPAPDGPEPSAS